MLRFILFILTAVLVYYVVGMIGSMETFYQDYLQSGDIKHAVGMVYQGFVATVVSIIIACFTLICFNEKKES